MEDFKYILAMVAVLVAGFVIVKKLSSCLWNIVVAIIVVAVFLWGLSSLGVIHL